MKQLLALLFMFLGSVAVKAQEKPSYAALKEYEGLYGYINNTTLKIAVSPKDTIAYAIINQSKYPLSYQNKDVFKNASGDRVVFLRNATGTISGYTVGKDTFSLVTKKVHFPESMWYARMPDSRAPFRYKYVQPKKTSDALATASIKESGLDLALLSSMVDKIVSGTYSNIHSVLIAKGNKLVFEEYFYDYGRDSLHEMRSATKSVVSALVGIAIDKGVIKDKSEKVLNYFPEYGITDPVKKNITIANMLENRSGLDCDISNPNSSGNETAMNFSQDWVKFTLDLPMIDVPGGKGMYCSGNPITLCRIIEKASGAALSSFAEENLFKPMDIKNYKWNFNPTAANAEDFCQLYLTPRSMLKFGLACLNKGNWNGRQVIPTGWVQDSTSKHSVIQGVNYGYLWWLKYLMAEGVRYEGIAAQGNGGQRIFLFPAQDMVVVITGGNYNSQSPSDALIAEYILPAFNKKR